MLHAAPGEAQVGELLLRGLRLRDDLVVDLLGGDLVGVLQEPAATHLPQRTAAARAGLRLEDAQVLRLALEHAQALLRVRGGDDDLVEHAGRAVGGVAVLAQLAGEVLIEGAVEGDDAAESAHRVGDDGEAVGLAEVVAGGGAAGVRVLHDDAGGLGEVVDGVPGGVGVEVVVVGELLAVVLHGGGDAAQRVLAQGAVAVEGGGLVRVLAVAQPGDALKGDAEGGGRPVVVPEPLGDGAVVAGDVLERLPGEPAAGGGIDARRRRALRACRRSRRGRRGR